MVERLFIYSRTSGFLLQLNDIFVQENM